MAYRKIDSDLKFTIIQSLWSGSNYSQLSKQYRIPRATIYLWEQTAKNAIISAFDTKTPGRQTVNLEAENMVLKEQLHSMYYNKHKTAQNELTEPKPVICEHCGSSHIKKNGTVMTHKDGLRQRYSCQACSLSIYVMIKKTPLPSK